MSQQKHSDEPLYRRFLRDEFDRRRAGNTSYSLRAFARDLKIESSKLSQYLSGHCGLSGAKARQIAEMMKLSALEIDLFAASADAAHARSETSKKLAKERLQELLKGTFSQADMEKFTSIRDWYHLAILELTELANFQSNTAWIAQALDIPEPAVSEAVERLARLGLLDRSGPRWVQTQKDLETPYDFASRAVREYHRQMMTLTQTRLDQVDVEKREVASAVFAVDAELVPEMKKLIRRFHKDAAAVAGRSQRKNSLYTLNLQLMPLYQESPS